MYVNIYIYICIRILPRKGNTGIPFFCFFGKGAEQIVDKDNELRDE